MAFYTPSRFEPDCSLGYLVRRVHQMGLAHLEPAFAAEGLTGTQWSALISIWFKRGRTCAELARDLGHDKGAMTRLVDLLEERGWITRTRDADDRRVLTLALTTDGRATAMRCRDRVIVYWNTLLETWDESEITTLIALMQKLRATLEDATAKGMSA